MIVPVVQPFPVANTLTQRMHKGINSTVDEGQTPVVAFHNRQDPDVSGPVTHPLGAKDNGMAVAFAENNRAEVRLCGGDGQVAAQLTTGGGKPGRGFPAVAFSCKDHGADAGDVAPTLRSMNFDGSHANGGGQVAVAFDLRGREGGAMPEGPHDTANMRAASGGSSRSYVAAPMMVRRLTPRECERLQGFPDDHTLIPLHRTIRKQRNNEPDDRYDEYLAKQPMAKDGPRYKALGNSFAVNVLSYIGQRIQEVSNG